MRRDFGRIWRPLAHVLPRARKAHRIGRVLACRICRAFCTLLLRALRSSPLCLYIMCGVRDVCYLLCEQVLGVFSIVVLPRLKSLVYVLRRAVFHGVVVTAQPCPPMRHVLGPCGSHPASRSQIPHPPSTIPPEVRRLRQNAVLLRHCPGNHVCCLNVFVSMQLGFDPARVVARCRCAALVSHARQVA